MVDNKRNEKILQFRKDLSKCVNCTKKTYNNKELILSYTPIKKQIGFITYGKATIIKNDINGNKTIIRELKENDIISNLFFQNSEDEIYIISNNDFTEVFFIDYYSSLKNCQLKCPFHTNMITFLFELLIEDNRQQNEKIELLSKRSVRDKILFFLKHRLNKDNIFKVTTSYKAIAEYISVDRSNFMRELNKMESEGIIEKNGGIIKLKK